MKFLPPTTSESGRHVGSRRTCCRRNRSNGSWTLPWRCPPAGSITPLTFHYILGLLASTGLRRSEAINLLLTDITPDGLHIRNTKFGGNRLVPLDDSVCRAIDEYLAVRTRVGGLDEHLFVLSTGRSVSPHYLTSTFIKLAREVGVRGRSGRTRAEAA